MGERLRKPGLSYRYRPPLIALIYLLLAILWILFSDRIVNSLVADPQVMTSIQTYKGLAFVFCSAVFLFFLIRASINSLARSEERYHSVLDGMLEGCQIIGRDWRYLYLNHTALLHSRKTEEDLIGHTMMQVYSGIEDTALFTTLKCCMEKSEARRIENLFTYPGGDTGWFELSIEPVPEGLFILSLDITERKRAEERIEHLNAVLYSLRGIDQLITRERDRARLIQQSCDLLVETRGYPMAWILLLDKQGHFTMAASAGPDKNISSLIDQFKQRPYPICVRRVLDENSTFALFSDVSDEHGDCPLVSYHKGGAGLACRLEYEGIVYGTITVDLTPELACDEEEQSLFKEIAGDIAFALAGIEKEEARSKWQNALQKSEEKLRLMFEAVTEGIVIIGLEDTVLEVNSAILAMYGTENKEELVGESIYKFIAGYDRKRVRENIASTITTGISRVVEYTLLRRHGSGYPAEVSISVLRDAAGAPAGIIAVIKDITERRRMEERMLVTDRLASIGELASGIAHELNNPLTGVIGLSELLLNSDSPPEIKEDIALIHSEAKRTSRIVKDLLTFARRHKTERQPVDINLIIQSALDLRAYELKVHTIEIATHFSRKLPLIQADGFQLQQVFFNIIINAEYFMIEAHNRGKLSIASKQVNDKVVVSFADNGPGIDEQNLKHIFDPFFTTKEVGKGTGLGLSICHGIISEHGGQIYVKSKLGKGAVFFVELPVKRD